MHKIEIINNSLCLGILDLAAFNNERALQKRDLEKEGIQYLLKQLFGEKQVFLAYLPSKKPYLQNEDVHISISHSHDKLAIIVNKKQNTGVDIELIREKVQNIQHKFLNPEEIIFAENDNEKLTTLWAAKEAIYKINGLKEVEFKENISIEPFTANENNFYGNIDLPNFKKRYLLTRQKLQDYILVYILDEV